MPEDFDTNFELVPPSTLEITPEEQLAASELLLDEDIEVAEDEPEPFGRSIAFDHENRRTTLYGGSPVWTDGLDTLQVWIKNMMWTERMAHTIFSDDFGMDDPYSLIARTARADLWQAYQSDLTEALLVHDRIAEIREIDMDVWAEDPEVTVVKIRILTDQYEELTVEQPMVA